MDVSESLISWKDHKGKVENIKLWLVVIVFHHTCIAECFDIQERTSLEQIYNTADL